MARSSDRTDLMDRNSTSFSATKGDVDLEAKLGEWERFYNFHRPHGAHNGKTPYEALREKL
jgi:transposase InsO family protein